MIIGRSSIEISLGEILDDKDIARISRAHVTVGFDGSHLHLVDMNSSNGSKILIWDSTLKQSSGEKRIKSGQTFNLKPRDLVVLADVLEIQRSGRRFPFDLAPLVTSVDSVKAIPKTIISLGE